MMLSEIEFKTIKVTRIFKSYILNDINDWQILILFHIAFSIIRCEDIINII